MKNYIFMSHSFVTSIALVYSVYLHVKTEIDNSSIRGVLNFYKS